MFTLFPSATSSFLIDKVESVVLEWLLQADGHMMIMVVVEVDGVDVTGVKDDDLEMTETLLTYKLTSLKNSKY